MSQNNATSLLEKLGFPASRYVRGRASVADMFRQGKRCGIYLLHCSNAEYYAGQATDVTRRYVQHRKTHADIERISFKRVRRDRLDIEERRVIWALEEAGIYLRNIAMSTPNSVKFLRSSSSLQNPKRSQTPRGGLTRTVQGAGDS